MILIVLTFLSLFVSPESPKVKGGNADEIRNTHVSDGVEYGFRYYAKQRWAVHTLTIDLTKQKNHLLVGKGLDNIAGLERVHSILHRYDSAGTYGRVVAGVNANFWKAGSNHPMGPCVSEGIFITGEQHRNWSSVAVTTDKRVVIGNFDFEHALQTRHGRIPISAYNSRRDSIGVVVYTPFYGTTVPFLDTAGISFASRDTVRDESEIDNGIMVAIDSLMSLSPENGCLKVQFRYLRESLANTFTSCIVTSMDTTVMSIPPDGGVISFGKGQFPLFFSLFVGDTFSLASQAMPQIPSPVVQMVSGTPRLVRDGRVSVEWQEEGLKKIRFVTASYGRTGIGISKDGDRILLVTVEPTSRKKRRRGISLNDLAALMIERGAYQALNLDGGSSATMVVGEETVSTSGGNRSSRKISVALLAVQRETEPSSSELRRSSHQ